MNGEEQPWVPLRLVKDFGCSKSQPLPAGGRDTVFSDGLAFPFSSVEWHQSGVCWPRTLSKEARALYFLAAGREDCIR